MKMCPEKKKTDIEYGRGPQRETGVQLKAHLSLIPWGTLECEGPMMSNLEAEPLLPRLLPLAVGWDGKRRSLAGQWRAAGRGQLHVWSLSSGRLEGE